MPMLIKYYCVECMCVLCVMCYYYCLYNESTYVSNIIVIDWIETKKTSTKAYETRRLLLGSLQLSSTTLTPVGGCGLLPQDNRPVCPGLAWVPQDNKPDCPVLASVEGVVMGVEFKVWVGFLPLPYPLESQVSNFELLFLKVSHFTLICFKEFGWLSATAPGSQFEVFEAVFLM